MDIEVGGTFAWAFAFVIMGLISKMLKDKKVRESHTGYMASMFMVFANFTVFWLLWVRFASDDLKAFATVAALAGGVAVAFSILQADILQDVMAGISMLYLDNTVRVGRIVSLPDADGTYGRVMKIGILRTWLKVRTTAKLVSIPNAKLSESIINWEGGIGNHYVLIDVHVDYKNGHDYEQVTNELTDVVKQYQSEVRPDQAGEEEAYMQDIEGSSLLWVVRFVVTDDDIYNGIKLIRGKLLERICARLDKIKASTGQTAMHAIADFSDPLKVVLSFSNPEQQEQLLEAIPGE